MIKVIEDMPVGTVGLEASGEVTDQDYVEVLEPALRAVHLRRRFCLVLLLAAVSPLMACSGESGERPTLDPSRSLTVTPSITATLPSPTRSLTRTPTDTDPPTTEATDAPSSTDTSAPPTATTTTTTTTTTPTPTATESEPTETVSSPTEPEPTPSPSPTPAAADENPDASATTPAWVWWLFGTLVAALAVGVPLLVRAHRRGAWQERLSAAEADVAWFSRDLVPELRRGSTVDRLAGGWAVSSQRVVALEDLLTSLVATAPDDGRRTRATELRDAVRGARTRVESLAGAPDASELALDLDEVAAGLEAALRPAAPAP